MKQVTIVVPKGDANLSSIAGSYQILARANAYWERLGNKPMMEICIASFETELKLDSGFFSIHPVDIRGVKNTDLLIIPSINYDYEYVINENTALIAWVKEQYKNGSEIASICTGAFLLAATGLLDGKACSTHWNTAADFRRMFPYIDLQPDKLITVGQ